MYIVMLQECKDISCRCGTSTSMCFQLWPTSSRTQMSPTVSGNHNGDGAASSPGHAVGGSGLGTRLVMELPGISKTVHAT